MKRFISSIYLYQSAAVLSLQDLTPLDADPVQKALFYRENGVDELLVFDMARDFEEQLKHLAIIGEICQKTAIPVTVATNATSIEDVKKLLYSGCRKLAFDFAKETNIAIVAEAAARFGKEKLAACVNSIEEITANEELLSQNISEIIIANEQIIRSATECSKLPLILDISQISLDKIIELLTHPVNAAIAGNAVNDNVKELSAIKELCRENGIVLNEFVPALDFSELVKNLEGLVPVIAQEIGTKRVLMLAYMNEEAFNKTIKSGRMTYFSRSRKELWTKGETSGHFQYLRSLTTDCDKDTLLAQVTQVGPACHTGSQHCFFNQIVADTLPDAKNQAVMLETLMDIIKDRKINPKEGSYTNYLFDSGRDKILKKLGEEAVEIIIAAKNPNSLEVKYEIADYLYHLMVLMTELEISWDDITAELAKR